MKYQYSLGHSLYKVVHHNPSSSLPPPPPSLTPLLRKTHCIGQLKRVCFLKQGTVFSPHTDFLLKPWVVFTSYILALCCISKNGKQNKEAYWRWLSTGLAYTKTIIHRRGSGNINN